MLSRALRGTITDEWFPKMTFAMIAPYLTPSTGVAINRLPHQRCEFTTVPVIIRARSETRKTAAFAVSEVLAGVFRKFRLAILAIIWSLVTFILRAKTSIVC